MIQGAEYAARVFVGKRIPAGSENDLSGPESVATRPMTANLTRSGIQRSVVSITCMSVGLSPFDSV